MHLVAMPVNIYQWTEGDISDDLNFLHYRCQNLKPQITLPHSLLPQNVSELYSEVLIGDMQSLTLSCEYQDTAGYLSWIILIMSHGNATTRSLPIPRRADK
jgi:hypothetical protein